MDERAKLGSFNHPSLNCSTRTPALPRVRIWQLKKLRELFRIYVDDQGGALRSSRSLPRLPVLSLHDKMVTRLAAEDPVLASAV